jgi:starch synthase
VHSHTWYTNLGGHFAKLLYGVPHVMTSHSLEPLRPWKAEQLGGGYELSRFCERTAIESADAVIAVSARMKQDIVSCYPAIDPERVHVIYNGIDPDQYKPDQQAASVHGFGVDPSAPYVVFVGRITRQKGVEHVLNAARYFDPGIQLVLCAGEPDTKELGDEVRRLVAELDAEVERVVWIERMLERSELIQLLSQARAFVCPRHR